MISKFGQRIKLEVFDKGNRLIFDSSGLRVDFHVIRISGYNRAKFSIYNLNDDTVKELGNGERYVRLSTALHDEEFSILIDNLFVSNALRETLVPNNVTSLFCYDALRANTLEKKVGFTTTNTTLEGIIKAAIRKLNKAVSLEFVDFPDDKLNYKPPKPISQWDGTVENLLKSLGKEYDFKYFIFDDALKLMYQPDEGNISKSGLDKREATVVLDSNNLKNNPKIGPATLQVTSNLDTNIVPTAIVDTSNLITAAVDVPEETLQVANDFIKKTVAGFSKYQCITVEHMGSNFTKTWDTRFTATAPRAGIKMATYNWFS